MRPKWGRVVAGILCIGLAACAGYNLELGTTTDVNPSGGMYKVYEKLATGVLPPAELGGGSAPPPPDVGTSGRPTSDGSPTDKDSKDPSGAKK